VYPSTLFSDGRSLWLRHWLIARTTENDVVAVFAVLFHPATDGGGMATELFGGFHAGGMRMIEHVLDDLLFKIFIISCGF